MAIANKNKNVLSEKILLDALDRVAKNPMGYTVLYVNISKLKPKNRHPRFVKVITKLFDSVVGTTKGIMFVLSNGDIAILSKNTPENIVDEAVKKLRIGLQADPILAQESQNFAKVYMFPKDYVSFYEKIEHMLQAGVPQQLAQKTKRALRAGEVESVIDRMDEIEIGEIVKRQSVLSLDSQGKFYTKMQEFFVAVKDLEQFYPSDIDFTADRWLFQYLTQVLDKKTLSAFKSAEIKNWPQGISVNLNLSSLNSKEFQDFSNNFIKPDQEVIVEVQMMEVLNNLNLYNESKEQLHEKGYKVLLDSLNPTSLSMLNLETLAPDMIKIFWEPLLEYNKDDENVKSAIKLLSAENVILAKCDTEAALKWGLSYGIKSYQGPFMDEIEIGLLRKECAYKENCSVQNCIKRHRLLQGSQRNDCFDLTKLEKIL